MSKFLKSKFGFTLVELLVVILILSILVAIAIPAYSAVNKKSKIKVCEVTQKEIQTKVKNYCVDNGYSEKYSFKIRSDSDEKKGILLDKNGAELKEAADVKLVEEGFLKGDIPFCPSEGTYTVTITPISGGMPKVEVSCDGDNGAH